MNRNQLKSILKINGYSESASDDEIRSLLLKAKYSETEIENALLILRQTDVQPMVRSDGLHTVFYTDSHLKPREIAGLLGVQVDFDASSFRLEEKDQFNFKEVMIIAGLSIVIAITGVFIYMYLNQIGFFHPS